MLVGLTISLIGAFVGQVGVASADLPVGSDQDTTGPQIAAFSFTPNSVDVRTADAQITGTAHLTDDLSGVDDVSIFYQSPSGLQSMSFRFTAQNRLSGTAQDGTYESVLDVATYREAGTWTVTGATTKDAVGNTASYTAGEAAALGASPFTVQSNPDTAPPAVTAVRWNPAPLDVSSGDGSVTFEWDITDTGGSGAWIAQIALTSPSGRQLLQGQGFDSGSVAQDAVTVSGLGTTSTPAPPYAVHENGVSQYSEPGIWTVSSVRVYDRAFNSRLYQGAELADILPATPFVVVADPVDVAAPEISAFRFSPPSVDVSTGPASVNVQFDVHDELSGVQSAWVTFRSPSIQASPPFLQRYGTWNQMLTELRVLNGTVTGRVDFPTYDRGGDWTVAQLCVTDRVKHVKCYQGDEIATRGPTTLTVVANEPPQVSVTGVTDGASYSQHPTAACAVVDREDGTISGVLPQRTGPVDGVYTVTCSYTDTGGKTGSATVTYRLDAAVGTAGLTLTKDGPLTANAGEELTYHLKVKNNGPDVATNVTVNDTLPAGLVAVSTDPLSPACQGNVTVVCNLGTLAVGQIGVATIVARAVQPGTVHNDATVTADQSDGNLDDNGSGWSTAVGPAPTVGVTKGVRVLAGPKLQYTIDVENLGPTTAYGVVAKDILDDPRWSLLSVETTKGTCNSQVVCNIGTLTKDEKATVTITLGVFVTEPIHNDVEVTWYGGGSTHAGVTSPGLPRLAVSKTHRGSFYRGGSGQYFVAVSNIGTGATTDAIVVTDTLPTGMTFASGGGDGFTCGAVGQVVTCTRTTSLDPGASANFVINVLVATDAPPQVNNVIEVGGGGGFVDPRYGDAGTAVDPPKLGVTKKVKERTVRVGHNFTYLIDVTNTGARTANNVTVIDALPSSVDLVSITPGAPTCTGTRTISCNLGDLPVGATVTVEIQVKAREITVLDNEAFASADGLLPVSSGHVSTQVKREATFEVTKTADKPVVVENANLRYTITAKNLGPGDSTNVKINDPLPANVELVSIDPDPTYGMTCNVSTPPLPVALTGPVVCSIPLLPELTVTKVVITVHVLRYGPLANTTTVNCDDCNPTGTSSTAKVKVKRPPAVAPIGPYKVPEASTLKLHGSGTDPDGDAITYVWDLDNNGTFETSGQNPVFSAVTRDGPDSQPITLKVCDVDNMCTTVGTVVTITNVPPTITRVTNNGPVNLGTPARIDVVASDVAGPIRDPLRYEFDCDNNGTYEVTPRPTSTASCTFTTVGTHTVRVRVNDGDGGVALGSTNVSVCKPSGSKK